MKSTIRLTKGAKIFIFILIALVTLGGAFYFVGIPKLDGFKSETTKSETSTNATNTTVEKDVMRISLDEWIGWKSVLDANGGLVTQKGSIYDKLGLNLEISIINDATQSSNAVISNDLDGAGYTVNRYAFLYPKFTEAKVPVKMPYITNYSSGGDGIIVSADIKSVEDLVGKKIAVPRFSEAQTLLEWLLVNSSLTDAQVKDIRKNVVYFDTPDDSAKAFFAGQVDASATWQPYLSQAQETSGARVLFDTKSATNLILDGVVFRKDYIDANRDKVTKFIEGALSAQSLYTTEFAPIKDSMPLFSTETNDNIIAMSGDATLADYQENVKLMKGVAQTLFKDMSNIWITLGENAMPDESLSAFDSTLLEPLGSKFTEKVTPIVKVTEVQREEAKATTNDDSLMKQTMSINFESGQATIKGDSYEVLNKFAETASLLNGVIIQIEGNTDSDGDEKANQVLSEARAKSVMMYLKFQGVDPTRVVIVGNGESKPVADNKTAEGKALNRRTDIFFKTIK